MTRQRSRFMPWTMLKLFAVFFALLASGAANARHDPVPLVDPPSLTVPQGLSADTVRVAVFTSALRRHWQILDKTPGDVVFRYAPRDFWVTVSIHYDEHEVRIAYKDSANLEYETLPDGPYIHPNYNRWVNNLYQDIALSLKQSQ